MNAGGGPECRVAVGVDESDGEGLVHAVRDLLGGQPGEVLGLLGGPDRAAGDTAAVDQGDDVAGHVLVDAGEARGLDVETGRFAYVTVHACVDGLAARQASA